MALNYLYTMRETHPALDMGAAIRVGPTITGSVSVTSSAYTNLSIYPNFVISSSNLNTGTDTCYVVSLFPTGSVPRRFIFEMSFTQIPPNEGTLFWGIGTADSSSLGLNAMCFSFAGDEFYTIASGVFSASLNSFATSFAPPLAADSNNSYIRKEFELKTLTFTTGSDVVFRCRELTTGNQANGTFQYDTIYKSETVFPWQKFPAAWNNKVFNKLFLGYRLPAGPGLEAGIFIDSIRVQKHYMDWDT